MRNRLWGVLVISLLAGCQKQPVAMSSQECLKIAEDIAAQKIFSSPEAAHEIHLLEIGMLMRDRKFSVLDRYMDELLRTDPWQLNTTAANLLASAVERPGLFQAEVSDDPHLGFHLAERWGRGHSAWGTEAQLLADLARFRFYGDAAEYRPGKRYFQGLLYRQRGVQALEKFSRSDKTWPSLENLDFLLRKDRRETSLEALLHAIQKRPEEAAGYVALGWEWPRTATPVLRKAVKELAQLGDEAYARAYVQIAPQLPSGKFVSQGWDWELLDKGFSRLAAAHPDSIALCAAQAQAALATDRPERALPYLERLGYHWNPDNWSSRDGYWNEQIADYHRSSSPLPALKVGPEAKLAPLGYARGKALQVQVDDLLRRDQFGILEALADQIRHKHPESIADFYRGCTHGKYKTDDAYERRKRQLEKWRESHPDSATIYGLLADFYVSYAWQARGDGYADTVEPEDWRIFKERLKQSKIFAGKAASSGNRDVQLLEVQMILCRALENDEETAARIARLALDLPGGETVLQHYATLLLPRWQGRPGDLARAADRLRGESGHDGAYLIMALETLKQEGEQALKSEVDWGRVQSSLQELLQAKKLPYRVAEFYLKTCQELKLQKDAARVLPALDQRWDPELWGYAYGYESTKSWAEGKAPWPEEKARWKFSHSGFWRNGSFTAGSSAESEADLSFGFEMTLVQGRGLIRRGLVRFDCRPAQPGVSVPSAEWYCEVYPDSENYLVPIFSMYRKDVSVPGTWTVTALDSKSAPLHQVEFTLK